VDIDKALLIYLNRHRVGNSGLKVSSVVLGCMTYGDKKWQPWVMEEEEALPIMKYAYDQGINTFDVADAYSNGRSEEIVGTFSPQIPYPAIENCHHEQAFFQRLCTWH
jgi:aryl-alcohol dehydrogenase-like predicted oxidoreductase